jgi:hypothetical protein
MLFRASARNAEAYLAGLVAILGLGTLIAVCPNVAYAGLGIRGRPDCSVV